MSDGVALLVAIVLLFANAFFVGAEFALVSARRTQIEPLVADGSRRARATLRAMRRVSLMMAGAQLGITLCSLGLGAVGEPAVAHLIEPLLHTLGIPDDLLHPIAFSIALLIVVSFHVVVGEMVPKNLALAAPERAAMMLGPPLASYVRITHPLIRSLNATANLVLRLVRVQPQDEVTSTATGEDLAAMVEESHREGLMDAEEHSRVAETLAFTRRTAVDVLIPRHTVVTLPNASTLADAETLAGATGHSRFPTEDWTRYVHLKDVIRADTTPSHRPAATLARTLPAVSVDTPLADVLAAMRDGSTHLLRVDDENGVLGLVTLHDVLVALLPQNAPS